ncbi:MAG: sulfatase-like hydrolase/transferase [Gemmatimonadaceae bacterium]
MALQVREEPEVQGSVQGTDIAYIDSEVGRLLRTLEGRGGLQNTLVVIAADHGEQFRRAPAARA